MKAATGKEFSVARPRKISIHAAREGGDARKNIALQLVHISIHAAREGGDIDINRLAQCAPISIHAAREGGD